MSRILFYAFAAACILGLSKLADSQQTLTASQLATLMNNGLSTECLAEAKQGSFSATCRSEFYKIASAAVTEESTISSTGESTTTTSAEIVNTPPGGGLETDLDAVFVATQLTPILTSLGVDVGLDSIMDASGNITEQKFESLFELARLQVDSQHQLVRKLFENVKEKQMMEGGLQELIFSHLSPSTAAMRVNFRASEFVPFFSKALFRLLDEDGNKVISSHELHFFDITSDGKVTMNEVNSLVRGVTEFDDKLLVPALFRIIDDDANGLLSAAELDDFVRDVSFEALNLVTVLFDAMEEELAEGIKEAALTAVTDSGLVPLSFETFSSFLPPAGLFAAVFPHIEAVLSNPEYGLSLPPLAGLPDDKKAVARSALAALHVFISYVDSIDRALQNAPGGSLSLATVVELGALLDLSSADEALLRSNQQDMLDKALVTVGQNENPLLKELMEHILTSTWAIAAAQEDVIKASNDLGVALLKFFDANNDDRLSKEELFGIYSELKALATASDGASTEPLARAVFRLLDPNGDGVVDVSDVGTLYDEMRAVLLALVRLATVLTKAVVADVSTQTTSTLMALRKSVDGRSDLTLAEFVAFSEGMMAARG